MNGGLHLIFGTGPVGTWTARALRELGHQVRAVNRTGTRPALMPAEVDIVAADASDLRQALEAARGAAVVYQALNPPYDKWQGLFPPLQRAAMEAARAAGARYVSIDNLYGYGPAQGALTEQTKPQPNSRKGRLRLAMTQEVLEAHARGDISAAILQASDYYGPGVLQSQFGERTFKPMLAGKPADLAASADLPHAPAVTQREMVATACRHLGLPPRIRVISPFMMRLAGLFIVGARESVEMLYQYTEPWAVSSAAIASAFGLTPTPIDEGLKRTVNWWRNPRPTAAA
jgi:nucleoside-diphosphate-sugar epimerase